ncbi:MAG: hypothetical protein KME05_17865 [Gloeocapsa sp. UFS-A4-WI-NPMV-4B04]|jgi:WD40 repeat protein|nr:hypothetical protein [Gloeocapsa sp. UFS-A4-WI-NPMV-4B04]
MTAWKALIALLTIAAIATIYLPAFPAAKTPSTTPLIVQAKPPSQLLRTLSGHAGPVWAIALSRNGETLVSASLDQTINLWNLKTGYIAASFNGHTGSVSSVAISPDGQTVVSGSEDKTIKLWDVKTKELRRTLTGHTYPVSAVVISPDGQIIARAYLQSLDIAE